MSLILTAGSRRRAGGGFEPDNGFTYPLPAYDTVVTVPTYDGSGESIHPGVVDMGQRWNGYRWWFVDTPYPNEDDQIENPSIFATNDRATLSVPTGLTNPLALPPAGGFFSDPDIVWDPDSQRMVVVWRDYVGTRTPPMYYRTAWSLNGVTWQESTPYAVDQPWWSPAICRVGPGQWRQWRFGGNLGPPAVYTSNSPLGPWAFEAMCDLGGASNWHGDIIFHNGQWLGMFSNKSNMWPMSSLDGITWAVGTQVPFIASYRPTFAPSTEAGEMDIWTSRMSRSVTYYRKPLSMWPAPPA